jgi:hypothetical protein
MPNHVTTVCDVIGSPADVAKFINKHIVPVKNEDGTFKEDQVWFDFDTIIEMPPILRQTQSGSQADVGLFAVAGQVDTGKQWLNQYFPNLNSLVPCERWAYLPKTVTTREALVEHLKANDPEALRLGQLSKDCLDKYGQANWYDWSVENWGTKWGAYDYVEREREEGRFSFQFDTAWSFPEPIFRALEKMYPELVFDIASYDEGSNFGCRGQFNGRRDYRCDKSLATDELYERVYGSPPEKYDEDEEEDEEEEELAPDEAELNDGLSE